MDQERFANGCLLAIGILLGGIVLFGIVIGFWRWIVGT